MGQFASHFVFGRFRDLCRSVVFVRDLGKSPLTFCNKLNVLTFLSLEFVGLATYKNVLVVTFLSPISACS